MIWRFFFFLFKRMCVNILKEFWRYWVCSSLWFLSFPVATLDQDTLVSETLHFEPNLDQSARVYTYMYMYMYMYVHMNEHDTITASVVPKEVQTLQSTV